jgi:hypothetical protein
MADPDPQRNDGSNTDPHQTDTEMQHSTPMV